MDSPDLLIRSAEAAPGSPTYHPVIVRWHKIIQRARPPEKDLEEPSVLRYSTFADPAPAAALEVEGYDLRIGSRQADFLQLAHYHRMLEACGFGADQALAGVIGTDDLLEAPVVAWADLGKPQVRTFSRSSPEGWRLRSILERYDYEHAFRLRIAAVAQQQTAAVHSNVEPAVAVEIGEQDRVRLGADLVAAAPGDAARAVAQQHVHVSDVLVDQPGFFVPVPE